MIRNIAHDIVQFADIQGAAAAAGAFAMAGLILRRRTGSGTRLYCHRRLWLPGTSIRHKAPDGRQ